MCWIYAANSYNLYLKTWKLSKLNFQERGMNTKICSENESFCNTKILILKLCKYIKVTHKFGGIFYVILWNPFHHFSLSMSEKLLPFLLTAMLCHTMPLLRREWTTKRLLYSEKGRSFYQPNWTKIKRMISFYGMNETRWWHPKSFWNPAKI